MTCNVDYNIISTGSKGNAVVINKHILIDCGVPFKSLKDVYQDLKLVLLTHIHTDHFNKTAIKTLAKQRPTLRFGCCDWLVEPLLKCGVEMDKIDVLEFDTMYGYGLCNVIPIPLVHNVPQCGYKLHFAKGKMIYATDTNNLNGITARGYDLFMIEANHEEEVIKEKIRRKRETGEYAYEEQALRNHLSKEKCDDFICKNIKSNGYYVYMHCHEESEDDNHSKDIEV